MRKTLLIAVVGAVMAMSSIFAQTHTQSLAFSGPAVWTPGTTITLSTTLTFNGYSSYGLSYWLEVPNAIAPFLSIGMPTYFSFNDPNNINPWPVSFNSTIGARAGYMSEGNDLGATGLLIAVPPGTAYHITDIPVNILSGAPAGTYTLFSTSTAPRISEVTDDTFSGNNIPAAPFVFTIVPEPSTLALLGLIAVGSALVAYRRCKS
jgi:hypothetical protein